MDFLDQLIREGLHLSIPNPVSSSSESEDYPIEQMEKDLASHTNAVEWVRNQFTEWTEIRFSENISIGKRLPGMDGQIEQGVGIWF